MQTLNTAFVDRVDAAIKSSPHLKRRELHCEIDDGHVVLKGVVQSYYQKQMAQEAVRHVDGVQHIDNELQVTWS